MNLAVLAASLGMDVSEPAFWMPLLLFAVWAVIFLAGVIQGGLELGMGVLLLASSVRAQFQILDVLKQWRYAFLAWLSIGMLLAALAFPSAWGALLVPLKMPLLLLLGGMTLRQLALERWLRVDTGRQLFWSRVVGAGALLAILGQGMAVGLFAVQFEQSWAAWWVVAFMSVGLVATYCALAMTWLTQGVQGLLQRRIARWARILLRWSVAGVVAVSMALAIDNPGVLFRWGEGGALLTALVFWGCLLLAVILLEMLLRRVSRLPARWKRLPFLLEAAWIVAVLGGLFYSVFPYLVLDEITLWDASADVDALRSIACIGVVGIILAGIIYVVRWLDQLRRNGAATRAADRDQA
ncbi:cytochrome d ubiquinol oxidase subunit II [Alcaligenaceae bacterium SJ-26]|nr:cytochrome d ubiquinol oxidase subunit II [Alcaligenaceae bacterium SJ-26]